MLVPPLLLLLLLLLPYFSLLLPPPSSFQFSIRSLLFCVSLLLPLGVSPNRIILLRDSNSDGVVDFRSDFLINVTQPLGIALYGNSLYIGCMNEILRFPYVEGVTKIERSMGEVIASLPVGGYNNHWTRNVIIHKAQKKEKKGEEKKEEEEKEVKLYVSVGSASNIGEHGEEEEVRRACVLEMDLDGSNERIFASGIRNPVGMYLPPLPSTSLNTRPPLFSIRYGC